VTQPEVNDPEQALPLEVLWLKGKRSLELALGFVDLVVLEELASSVKVEEELLSDGRG
jgi:hypothetical protein